MYAIVVFSSDRSYDIAPKSWPQGENKCFWPPPSVKSYDVASFIRHSTDLGPTWVLHKVTILSEAATYSEARHKAKKAQSTSELTFDPDDYGRGKRINKRKRKDSSSDEDCQDTLIIK